MIIPELMYLWYQKHLMVEFHPATYTYYSASKVLNYNLTFHVLNNTAPGHPKAV